MNTKSCFKAAIVAMAVKVMTVNAANAASNNTINNLSSITGSKTKEVFMWP